MLCDYIYYMIISVICLGIVTWLSLLLIIIIIIIIIKHIWNIYESIYIIQSNYINKKPKLHLARYKPKIQAQHLNKTLAH